MGFVRPKQSKALGCLVSQTDRSIVAAGPVSRRSFPYYETVTKSAAVKGVSDVLSGFFFGGGGGS